MHADDGVAGKLDPEAKYAASIRERKGFTDKEKAKAEHFEHGARRDFGEEEQREKARRQ